ncbi:hypothetical protein M3Y94_00006000 [Aphelenchoides besseyi]|nr:hypothetical protein M3Y94_00006000 [Aphelenchoides besseyi]
MHGFVFENCTEPAEVTFKWKDKRELRLALNVDSDFDKVQTFQLVINDQCSLTFTGNAFEASNYGTWTTEDGKVTNASFLVARLLFITNFGNLIVGDGRKIGCRNKILRNQIDDDWVWSKFRLSAIPKTWSYYILINGKVDENEGDEYDPLAPTIEATSSTSGIEESTTSVEESTSTIEESTSTVEASTTSVGETSTSLPTSVIKEVVVSSTDLPKTPIHKSTKSFSPKFHRSDDSANAFIKILGYVGESFTLLVKLLLSFLSCALYGQ